MYNPLTDETENKAEAERIAAALAEFDNEAIRLTLRHLQTLEQIRKQERWMNLILFGMTCGPVIIVGLIVLIRELSK